MNKSITLRKYAPKYNTDVLKPEIACGAYTDIQFYNKVLLQNLIVARPVKELYGTVYYNIHNRLPLVPVLIQTHQLQILKHSFLKIYFTIIFSTMPDIPT
jgi:hypothetical protein